MADTTIESIAAQLGRDHSTQFERRMPNRGATPVTEPSEPIVSNGIARILLYFSGFSLAAAVLILIAAQYLGHEIAKGGYSDSTKEYEIVIGNDVISVPSNMIRFRNQRKSAAQLKLELFVHWPSMQGYSEALKPYFVSAEGQEKIVFISLEPRAMALDMAGRIDPIYRKFFAGPSTSAGNGLMKQPLDAESGYIDEDLYIQANSPYPFVARCLREQSAGGKPYCIRDIHVGADMMATYRFHNSLLKEWMTLDELVRNQLHAMLRG